MNAGTSEFIQKKKPSKISNITFATLRFSHKNTLTKLPSWVLWSLFLLIKASDVLQNGSFDLTQRTQNLKLVNLKCVSYYFSTILRVGSLPTIYIQYVPRVRINIGDYCFHNTKSKWLPNQKKNCKNQWTTCFHNVKSKGAANHNTFL